MRRPGLRIHHEWMPRRLFSFHLEGKNASRQCYTGTNRSKPTKPRGEVGVDPADTARSIFIYYMLLCLSLMPEKGALLSLLNVFGAVQDASD